MKAEISQSAGAKAAAGSHTRQWILVGILSLVLLAAVLMPSADDQKSDAAAEVDSNPVVEVTTASAEPPAADELTAVTEEVTQVRQLPRIELQEILRLDPLARVSLATATAASETTGSETAALEGSAAGAKDVPPPDPPKKTAPPRVQAIYGSERGGAAALVERQIVRQGQPLTDGRKVIDVSKEGVRLADEVR